MVGRSQSSFADVSVRAQKAKELPQSVGQVRRVGDAHDDRETQGQE